MRVSLNIESADFNADYERTMSFVRNTIKGLEIKDRNRVELAFEEVFVNILTYNQDKKDLNVAIEIICNQENVDITIKDNGKEFNPLERENPDFSLSADERKIGGLGIFLLKEFTDYVKYEYMDNCNNLMFGVKLNG